MAIRAGVRDVPPAGDPLHPVSSFMVGAERRWNMRWGCLIALDLTYNQSLRAISFDPLSVNDRIQFASGIGNQWHFGRAHLAMVHGWVWTNPDHILGQRHLHTAFAYEAGELFFIELGLRSIRLRADYTLFGYSIHPVIGRHGQIAPKALRNMSKSMVFTWPSALMSSGHDAPSGHWHEPSSQSAVAS